MARSPASCAAPSSATSSAGTRGRGARGHTKYPLRSTPARVTLTRRHHPLEGREFEVLRGGDKDLVIRGQDGLPMKVPRAWTSADGASVQAVAERVFSQESLERLLELVEAFKRRS